MGNPVGNPVPVVRVKPAVQNQSFYFDPTYTPDKDALLPCGKVSHKTGTKVNPLEYMQLNRQWFFFIDSREVKLV